ncbi:MAG: DUF6152 family protein [Acidobacteria bacterium]|nr:DUF6152 family protein [Acidobacteriota bacterium]MCZ6752566.1 DUF6152 family protein [Acidobacteriota bacterium]
MKRELLAVLAVAVGLLIASGPLLAHHSTSLYDKQHVTTLQGTVTALEFINPHVQIRFEVKDSQGNVEKWVGVCSPPNALRRAGWNRNSLKPGDQITVGGGRVKDGRKIISVEKVVLSDGKELPMRSLD